jgi:hypothetical protein
MFPAMWRSRTMLAGLLALAPGVAGAGGAGQVGRTRQHGAGKDTGERVFTAAAAVRMGIVIGAGDVVVQPPLGFGFGFKLAFYPVRAGPMRFGFAFNGGHDRFMSRRVIVSESMTDRGRR